MTERNLMNLNGNTQYLPCTTDRICALFIVQECDEGEDEEYVIVWNTLGDGTTPGCYRAARVVAQSVGWNMIRWTVADHPVLDYWSPLDTPEVMTFLMDDTEMTPIPACAQVAP